MNGAIKRCYVDNCGDFPIHRPLIIEIECEDLTKEVKELIKPINMAELMEERIQTEVQKEEEAGKARIDEGNATEEDKKPVHENEIRKRCIAELEADG